MYSAQAGARAADGVASHGSLDAYTHDFHACSKAFEMFVADRLSTSGQRFLLWEDLDAATKEVRGLTKADAGVDVTDGATTLVQCKLRARYLTWRECATFFASAVSFADGAYHVPWRSLTLARNACCKLSRTLAELGSSRPFDFPVELSEFRAYAQECLAEHESAQAAEPRQTQAQAQELRDYQVEAIALCAKETTAPAYVVLPTGCGKSLVMALVAAGSIECRVLIFVPLVVLLEQFIEVLLANGCEALAVGGGHECTAGEVSAARVVVCVYNSAHKVDATTFKIVLIDEAHCVRRPAIYSDLDDDYAIVESDESVDSVESPDSVDEDDAQRDDDASNVDAEDPTGSRTVSRTGSPRSARGAGYAAVRAASRHPNARLLSATQDVPEGAESCQRTLRWTIDAGYLCDYTLDVPVFDVGAGNADVARFLVRNYRSIIVFCSTHAQGTAFCAAMNELGPCARYIDCDTGRRERNEVLAAFRSGNLAFVVNVRVLAMGFDAPITKGVCFVSMPASKTHIVQVIGRCLRLHPDKRIAHVILPLVAGAEDEDTRVRDFMRVLAQNDTRFAHALRANGGGYVSVRRVESDAGSVAVEESADLAGAAEALYTAVYDSMGVAVDDSDRWSARFDELVAYHAEHSSFPPRSTPGGLGAWVNMQRCNRATMSVERKARLEALEWWKWSVRAAPVLVGWDARFDELVAYHAEHGRLPTQSAPGGLGSWAGRQRAGRATMDAERKARLEALGWWMWDTLEDAWSTKFDELVAYHAEHGRLPRTTTPGLGSWVTFQRQSRETMGAERKARLESLQWWVWDALDSAWSTHFDELVAYHAEHGRVPPQNGGLGSWVGTQRSGRATMSAERKARLDALPWWVWDTLDGAEAAWNTRFDELVAYHAEHGRVAPRSILGLGSWVDVQRSVRATMSAERKARLDALPWWAWDPLDDAWSTHFDELVAYNAEHGRFPPRSTPRLGAWVNSQRVGRATMDAERKARLEALPWWVWDTRDAFDDAWTTQLGGLVAYHAEHGVFPPQSTPGGLGKWVNTQRAKRGLISADRKARLEALEWWVWDMRVPLLVVNAARIPSQGTR
jgi:hypothetical protein